MNSKTKKVPVSRRALVQRINRALKKDRENLKTCSSNSRSYNTLGEYYIIDLGTNCIIHTDVDIEAVGRKRDILKQWEILVDD